MSEKFLDAAQISAVVQEMCREAVSQRVGADRRIQTHSLQILVELAANRATAESTAVLVQEERKFGAACAGRGAELRISLEQFHVTIDRAECV